MSPSIPGYVLAPMVGREDARHAFRGRKQAVPRLGNDKVSSLHAGILESRTGEAKAGGGDQVGPPDGVPAHCEALGIVQRHRCRLITRKPGQAARVFVLKVAAPKQIVATARVQGVIEPRGVEVIPGLLRCRETEALDVQPIAHGEVVGQRIGLHVLQKGGVDSNPGRIDSGLEIVGSQTRDSTVGCSVLNDSLAEVGRGHGSQDPGTTPIPAALVVQKIVQPVLSDRATHRPAEHVHQEGRTGNAGLVIEK